MHQDLLQLLYGHCIPGLSFGACSFTVLFVAKPCKWPIITHYRTSFPQNVPEFPCGPQNAISGDFYREEAPNRVAPEIPWLPMVETHCAVRQ